MPFSPQNAGSPPEVKASITAPPPRSSMSRQVVGRDDEFSSLGKEESVDLWLVPGMRERENHGEGEKRDDREKEAARDCPVAKGIRKRLQTLMFPALTHLLTDVLAVVNRINLTFQKQDVNISSIQPVVNMTLASLDDLMNGPGEAETKCNEALQDGEFCSITLTQADAQTFSRVRTEYIAEMTKSIKKRFPSEHVGIIADLDTVINASRYPAANSARKV
ncbi:hypothetical protein JOQ06_023843 [Pogonophryne albipinna]|uniref:Uncharacterized protein n=1 Tax=Pogonophryne albipinna TaxID=1090488 RepID=A0AAD6FUR3_9TELE|nr:hypothetical protein JOQ06_023843 [Pogonophryne albipinna]